tara:strand:+ start:333 stop:674 length:342 start_codon:yes stop_codon:yes gene_type:complete
MAIPSGAGAEVLKNAQGTLSDETETAFTVGTNKIVTLLNIILHATQATESTAQIILYDGGADHIMLNRDIPGRGTYIWNVKQVLQPTEALKIVESQNYAMTYWVNYIEQDWSS